MAAEAAVDKIAAMKPRSSKPEGWDFEEERAEHALQQRQRARVAKRPVRRKPAPECPPRLFPMGKPGYFVNDEFEIVGPRGRRLSTDASPLHRPATGPGLC